MNEMTQSMPPGVSRGYQANGGPIATAQEPPLNIAIGRLFNQLDILQETGAVLVSRLATVLGPERPEKIEPDRPPGGEMPVSEATARINAAADQVCRFQRAMQAVLHRLET
jgi:hypothetical protein